MERQEAGSHNGTRPLAQQTACYRSISPLMKASTLERAAVSSIWMGGDFMKYAAGLVMAPPIPSTPPR